MMKGFIQLGKMTGLGNCSQHREQGAALFYSFSLHLYCSSSKGSCRNNAANFSQS